MSFILGHSPLKNESEKNINEIADIEIKENKFLENEESDDNMIDESTNINNHKLSLQKKILELKGKSKTVSIFPVYNWMNEYHIRQFVKDIAEPVHYYFMKPKNRFSNIRRNALFYANIAKVTFPSAEDAVKVVDSLNQTFIHGKLKPHVNYTWPSNFISPELRGKTTNIKMTNIPKSVDEQQIMDFIKENTDIQTAQINVCLFHHSNNKFQGYAYIHLASFEDAIKCVDELRWKEMGNNKIFVCFNPILVPFKKREHLEGKTKYICVSNIHYSAVESDIKEIVQIFGTVNFVKMCTNINGYSIGRCIIMFCEENEAIAAFNGLNKYVYKNKEWIAGYSTFVPKRKKKNYKKMKKSKKNAEGKGFAKIQGGYKIKQKNKIMKKSKK